MSSFELAIPIILLHEGGFVDDKHDPGGATNYGVSLRWLRAIGGLDKNGYQDADVNQSGEIDTGDIKAMKQEDAIHLYRKYWWDKYQYERINDQTIANKVFDLAINMGATAAHRCLQRAIRATTGEKLIEDGIFGLNTLTAINNAPADKLLAAYRSEAAGFYRSLKNPRYEKGWLARAYS